MIRMFKNRRAQTTAEYAILIAIVVGAVIAMQVYVKRGLQGRTKNVVDARDDGGVGANISADGSTAFTWGTNDTSTQYEPYYTASSGDSGRISNQQEVQGSEGKVGRAVAEGSRQRRTTQQGWAATQGTSLGLADQKALNLPENTTETIDPGR